MLRGALHPPKLDGAEHEGAQRCVGMNLDGQRSVAQRSWVHGPFLYVNSIYIRSQIDESKALRWAHLGSPPRSQPVQAMPLAASRSRSWGIRPGAHLDKPFAWHDNARSVYSLLSL